MGAVFFDLDYCGSYILGIAV